MKMGIKRMVLYFCLIVTGFNVMLFIMGIITGRISSIVIGGICAIITAVCTKIHWENYMDNEKIKEEKDAQ